jgi:hypothetical protein
MGRTPPTDPDEFLRQFVEAGRNVKFGRGVVGKTNQAALGLIGLWLAIVLKVNNSLALDAVLVGCGILGTGAVIWWIVATQKFAAENPAQAMLEGAELIEYQKFEASIKGGAVNNGVDDRSDAPSGFLR